MNQLSSRNLNKKHPNKANSADTKRTTNMAKRDPNKTARNRKVADIKVQRRALQSSVFDEMRLACSGKYTAEASLNAFIGSKTDDYIKLHDEVIKTPIKVAPINGMQ